MTGVVTRGGKPVGGGRVGGWQKRRKEMNRVNVAILRGRTLPMWGYEFVRTTVNSDGTFALENLKAGPWFGPWFFVYEEPTGPPTIVGPVTITSKDRTMTVDIAVTEGGAIEGRVENVPAAMAGQVWVIAFDATILRREALVSADGTLPPGGLAPRALRVEGRPRRVHRPARPSREGGREARPEGLREAGRAMARGGRRYRRAGQDGTWGGRRFPPAGPAGRTRERGGEDGSLTFRRRAEQLHCKARRFPVVR